MIQNDTTEPRHNNPLSKQAKSYISNNRIMKKLRQYNEPTSKYAIIPKVRHAIEFILDSNWAAWRKQRLDES